MVSFAQEIKFVGSFIISDDTGQLIRLIQAIGILIGMLITLLRVVAPLLELAQELAVGVQRINERVRYYRPYVPAGAG